MAAKQVEVLNRFLNVMDYGRTLKKWVGDKIIWAEVTGPRGIYQRADKERNLNVDDFELLLEDLGRHGGRLYREDHFYWRIGKSESIGRKRTR